MIVSAGSDVRSALTDAFSLEVTIRDIPSLAPFAQNLPAGTLVSITHLAHESDEARVAAACEVRRLGLEPMPHISARSLGSFSGFEAFMSRSGAEAGVDRYFIIAGDTPKAKGPFPDSAALIATDVFERSGVRMVGVAGYPDGCSMLSEAQCWSVLEAKCRSIAERGMAPLIVTQFVFDANVVLSWLKLLRERGLEWPVRIGVPGPASVGTLVRFATRCGVGASTSVLSKYGLSAGKLLRTAGPDTLVDDLAAGLGDEHGNVRLHFYPFGGIAKTVDWIKQYRE